MMRRRLAEKVRSFETKRLMEARDASQQEQQEWQTGRQTQAHEGIRMLDDAHVFETRGRNRGSVVTNVKQSQLIHHQHLEAFGGGLRACFRWWVTGTQVEALVVASDSSHQISKVVVDRLPVAAVQEDGGTSPGVQETRVQGILWLLPLLQSTPEAVQRLGRVRVLGGRHREGGGRLLAPASGVALCCFPCESE